MQTSEAINEIAEALAKAQGELEPAPKDATNPNFKSHYATLASCRAAAKPVLARHGLAVVQGIVTDPGLGMVGVTTRIIHRSGQWIESKAFCQPRDLGAQSVGAASTYLQRYGLCAAIGLASVEDDDGNSLPAPKPSKNAFGEPVRPLTGPEAVARVRRL